ncbi:MAG: polysaccharide deacetylase [Acidobacteria bacterium OLB17]|nr:MAG: polysaccharide deacetylase [Acidobacteria bacterium OLB17]MCZ2390173.1 polysaccharide deacetylase family protein [Acidobacteriota bacterium]
MKDRIASLSLDLDNQWSYMKTHGDAGWESFPSYLDRVVPAALSFLEKHDQKITFFIVGQDAALEKNREALRSIADAGHEIGNHSFHHEPWLHLYSKAELIEEFERSEAAIEEATGRRPKAFRGPGFSLSPLVLETLAERGYDLDCSTFPTYIAPLARAYYFFTAPKMSDEEREKRKQLFGKFSDGFKPLNPYIVSTAKGKIAEIPVTTFPGVKTPIHASYVIYLSTFSLLAAKAYWRSALSACRIANIQPSLLLHPLDFLTGDDVPELKFFPGMGLAADRKLGLLDWIVSAYKEAFDVTTVGGHAAGLRERLCSANEAQPALP